MTEVATQTDEEFVVDLAKRTVFTAVEAALASGAVVWGGSGLGIGDLTNVSGLDKAWSIIGVTVLASFAASVRATWSKFWAVKADRVRLEAVGKDLVVEVEQKVGLGGKHAASKAAPMGAGVTPATPTDMTPPAPAPLVTGASDVAQYAQEHASDPLVTDDSPQANQPIGEPEEPASELSEPATAEIVAAPPTVVVYDANGQALGNVDPSAITNGEPA